MNLQVNDFDFHLPEHLIAQYPTRQRSASRLLHLNAQGKITDSHFFHLVDVLQPGDLLVYNDTRVIPARLNGNKTTGGKVEILIERILDNQIILAQIKANRSPKPGTQIILSPEYTLEVIDNPETTKHSDPKETQHKNPLYLLQLLEGDIQLMLERVGQIPLPPYIKRSPHKTDQERYQPLFAKEPGAIAAPTAALHFDQPLLNELEKKGIQMAHVTLHVGAGTFQPIRVKQLTEHNMHYERIEVSQNTCDQINKTKGAGKRIIAVGTTTVRSLETACLHTPEGQLIAPFKGETNIFIYPGYQFHCIDTLITNFHLPQSTLIMLVSAFAGYNNVLDAYHHAVKEQYRFFSYGDAMLAEKALAFD